VAAPLENLSTFTRLHHWLKLDLRFRYQCGLRLDRKAPSIATLSRVFADFLIRFASKKGLSPDLMLLSIAQDF